MKISLKTYRFFSVLLSAILFFNLFVSNYLHKNLPNLAVFLMFYWFIFYLCIKRKDISLLQKIDIPLWLFILGFILLLVINKFPIYVSLLVIYLLIFNFFIKPKRNNKICASLWIIVLSILFLLLYYILGMFYNFKISSGFYINPIHFINNAIWIKIFPHCIIIIFLELIRSLVISQNDKKANIWISISMILLDITLNIRLYSFSGIGNILEMIGCLFIPSICLNLLFNYICKRYGSAPNIIYKFITVIIFNYYMPFLPDLYPIFETLLKTIYPFIVYFIIDGLLESKELESNQI